jgi:hypothetical protein
MAEGLYKIREIQWLEKNVSFQINL